MVPPAAENFTESSKLSGSSGLSREKPQHSVGTELFTHAFKRNVIRYSTASLLTALLVTPLFFGAVHPAVYLTLETVIFGTAFLLMLTQGRLITLLSTNEFPASRFIVYSLLLFIAYLLIQSVVFLTTRQPHFILGTTSLVLDTAALRAALRHSFFFAMVFLTVRMLLQLRAQFAFKLNKILLLTSVIVAMVALGHWVHDTGKLFWIFSPDYVNSSERARWPFVNPNNLAQFLLPLFFLTTADILTRGQALFSTDVFKFRCKDRVLQATTQLFLTSKSFQRDIFSLLFLTVSLLIISLALLGSQSRGSLLGWATGILLFVAIRKFLSRKENLAQLDSGSGSRRRRSKQSNHRQSVKLPFLDTCVITITRHLGSIALLGAVMLLALFFNERGAELLGDRLALGLLYAKDDMRWQLYLDSLKMIQAHPFFGVGLGQWASAYPEYMNQLLAGVNPVFMHSDPLQLLAEAGVVGSLPVALLFVGFLVLGLRCVMRIPKLRAYAEARIASNIVTALLCGLISAVISSLIDFPFHIPAINFSVATLLALWAYHCDSILKT